MQVFLIILFYITIFSYFTYSFNFYKLNTISKSKLIALLNIKFFAAILYLYFSKHYIVGGDIFHYYKDSLIIFNELKAGNILNYMNLTFGLNNVAISENIAPAINQMGFWFDTPSYFMVRLNSIFNLFSLGKSIYVNALFFGFISFNACIILAKLFQELFNYEKNWISYFIFLTPSLLYWTSGMHKESISTLLISLLLYSYFKIIKKPRITFFVLFITSIFFLVFTRVFIIILFIPPLLSYIIWHFRQKIRPIIITGIVSIITLLATYILPQILNTSNLVDIIIEKKNLYEALGVGNTAITLGEYQQSYWGIFTKIPQAIFNGLVRPHFLDVDSFFLLLACVESFIISILFISSLFYIKNLKTKERAIVIVFIFFGVSYLTLAGLIVPNLGAILRYRSVSLFILVPTIIFLLSKKDKLL